MAVEQSIERKALNWAIEKHRETNHFYDGKAYDVHLWMVVDIAKMFIHYIPEDKRDIVLSACWLHDTIEDCRVTYNDVKAEFGEEVAEIVYALTNEKGRTRKDRANDKYYEGIRATPYASFVKICDRAANIKYSFGSGSTMFDKYLKENESFQQNVDPIDEYAAMHVFVNSFFSAAL